MLRSTKKKEGAQFINQLTSDIEILEKLINQNLNIAVSITYCRIYSSTN